MGEQISGPLRLSGAPAAGGGSLAVVDHGPDEGEDAEADQGAGGTDGTGAATGRRRFTVACVVSTAVVAVPYVWVLLGPWLAPDALRRTNFQDNFYDSQARAMFHGHFYLPNGSLGIEGFVHGGHTYTYFGLFPSLIRMPVLVFTSSLDGRLTVFSLLLAWLVTALFASFLIWRVRILARGTAALSWTEASFLGVLLATCMGGTIWLNLAATPYVFNEDIGWSVCLTVASLFGLLGIAERPGWGRIIFTGIAILCANLDRSTTGWACVVGAALLAGWFLLGRAGPANRRWCVPVLLAGVVPLVVGMAVNEAKFGVLFGVSNLEQVWTHVNAYRRRFLASHHGAEEGLVFVPTNALTYLRPTGIGLTNVFPFVTLPASPPTAVGGILFDRLYRTPSITASSPLLVLLSLWGLVTAFRPRPIGSVARTRLLLLAAGSAGAALLLWGYIAPRYLGDFLPFLYLAGAVGLVDLCRRLAGDRRWVRGTALALVAVAALYSIVANFGMAVGPMEGWTPTQAANFVAFQHGVSDLTGRPLDADIVRGARLPAWGPAGRLFIVGDCAGLYVSDGEDYSTVSSSQFTRSTWMTVELGHEYQHTFELTVPRTAGRVPVRLPLVSAGPTTLSMAAQPAGDGSVRVTFAATGPSGVTPPFQGTGPSGVTPSLPTTLAAGSVHQAVVVTDSAKRQARVEVDGTVVLNAVLAADDRPLVVHPTARPASATGGGSVARVADVTSSSPGPALCRSLLTARR